MTYASLETMQVWADSIMQSREPDFLIGGDPAQPYMRRWWVVPRNEKCNVYLHEILRDDDDRALHDHPWENTSFLLRGSYRETLPQVRGIEKLYNPALARQTEIVRVAGDVISREATDSHRLSLIDGQPCVSLFMTGPKVRDWGFWCESDWVPWQVFTDPLDKGKVSRGCD